MTPEKFWNDSDKQAYAIYYSKIPWGTGTPAMTYNEFYGSDIHKEYLLLLRKTKLDQLKKVSANR
jgi:hypothetical protein